MFMCVYIYIHIYIYIKTEKAKTRNRQVGKIHRLGQASDARNLHGWEAHGKKHAYFHARGAGPITWTSSMTLAGTGKQNILYNDLLYHRVPADMGPNSHDVSWYGGV